MNYYYIGEVSEKQQRFGSVWTARINTISDKGDVWNGCIEVHGYSRDEAEILRDKIYYALKADAEIENLRAQLEAANKLIVAMREKAI